jgi:hypothetical protein
MFVLRLSVGGVSFRHRSCVAGHGTRIRVVTYIYIYIYIKINQLANYQYLKCILNIILSLSWLNSPLIFNIILGS